MTKEELIKKIKNLTGLTEAADEKVVDNFAEHIYANYRTGSKIKIEGLGFFQINDSETGEKFLIFDETGESESLILPVNVSEETGLEDEIFSFSFGKPVIDIDNSEKINKQKEVEEFLSRENIDDTMNSFFASNEITEIEEESGFAEESTDEQDTAVDEALRRDDLTGVQEADKKEPDTEEEIGKPEDEQEVEVEKAEDAAVTEDEDTESSNLVLDEENEMLGEVNHEEKLEEETEKILDETLSDEDKETDTTAGDFDDQPEDNENIDDKLNDEAELLEVDEVSEAEPEIEENLSEEEVEEDDFEIEDSDKRDISESDLDLIDAELKNAGVEPIQDEISKTRNDAQENKEEEIDDTSGELPEEDNSEIDQGDEEVSDDEIEDSTGEDVDTNWGDELKNEFADSEDESIEDETFINEDFADQPPDQIEKTTDEENGGEVAEKTDEDDEKGINAVAAATASLTGEEETEGTEADPKKLNTIKSEKAYPKKKKGLGVLFWSLLTAFFVVLIGGIYFFFFFPESSEDIRESNLVENNDQNVIQNEPEIPANENAVVDNQDAANESATSNENEATDESVDDGADLSIAGETEGVEEESTQGVNGSYYKNVTNETAVGGYIYYDGDGYNVQVASYKSQSSAEEHVLKLREAGLNAFIVKDYLERIGGDWYRVRVGYFDSKQEARKFQGN